MLRKFALGCNHERRAVENSSCGSRRRSRGSQIITIAWNVGLAAGSSCALHPVAASRSRFLFRFWGGASAIAKSVESIKNLPAEQPKLTFSESGNIEKLICRRRIFSAEFVERRVIHYQNGGNTLLLRGGSPPLAKVFAEFWIHFSNGHFGLRFSRLRPHGNSCQYRGPTARRPFYVRFICHPMQFDTARIACIALSKFWVLAKMRANLAMAAVCRFHKIPNGVIALPGAIFFGGIGQLSNEISEQSRVSLLPKHNTVRGLSVAARASGFLIILLD